MTWSARRTFAAAISIIDQNVEDLVVAFKSKLYGETTTTGDDDGSGSTSRRLGTTPAAGTSYYENTYFIMTSDNGAPSKDGGGVNGGSTYPLRGYKGKIFDGALRVPAFIHSALIPAAAVGSKYDGIMHSTDWLRTMAVG